LSNPMAINRGLATHEMAVAIIEEYQRRKKEGYAFAEWFSIDPPFPDGIFGDDKLVAGAYINGGIFPLAGGELALAAFENGFEDYGVNILRQYRKMIGESGETYLWYFPDGRPSTVETSTSPDALPTDGWGSSAMLYAFVEGLCGVKDMGHSLNQILLAPRWISAGQDEANVHLVYPASGAEFSYEYRYNKKQNEIRLLVKGGKSTVHLHLLIPSEKNAGQLTVDGKRVASKEMNVRNSLYVDADFEIKGQSDVMLKLS